MRNKNFFMIPNRIFSLGLKPKEFAGDCCLIRHSDREKNSCFPSRRLIAQECNMDKKTVDSAIKGLEERELVKRSADNEKTEHGQAISIMFSSKLNSVKFVSV